MASRGLQSEEGEPESLYDRDSSSQHKHYQQTQRRGHQHPHQHLHPRPNQPPQFVNQTQSSMNQSCSSHNSYLHEQFTNGQFQNRPPYHPNKNGNAFAKTHGNYNNTNQNNAVPIAPRLRMRKWSDMTRTIWHYERIEQIGEGTYGQVYRARCRDTNEIVAMKKIRVHHGAHWGMPPTVIREIKILKRLVHPNLVRMYEVVSSKGVEHLDADDYHKGSDRSRKNKHKSAGGHVGAETNKKDRDSSRNNNNSTKNDSNKNTTSKQIDISDAREGYKGNLFLVLEYVPYDLTGLLDVAYRFSEVEIKCVFRQLLEALKYMHAQKYVHRDIKSSNILIDRNFRLKLADFGLARSIEPPLLDKLHDRGNSQEFTNKVITLWYRPPELLLGATRYGFAVDIWSAGCILAELVLGRPLFTGKTEMEQLQLIFDMVGTPTDKTWPGVRELKLLRTKDVTIDGDTNRKRPKLREKYQAKMNKIAPGSFKLVEKLLELDPTKRLTASRASNHLYFLQEPRAPDQPEALGAMRLAEGGSFHEFQTKKKRKEAKAEAEKIKQAALDGGQTMKQAQEEYDACYRTIMETVARKGLESSTVVTGKITEKENESDDKSREGERIEMILDGHDDRHSDKHQHSSKSHRSLDYQTGTSKSSRDKDNYYHRESSSRGRDKRSRERERSGGSSRHKSDRDRSGDKDSREKYRDETGSSNHYHRDHGRERYRSSRRISDSDGRRKKRLRDSSKEDVERYAHDGREKDKERHRQHQKESKEGIGAISTETNSNTEHQSKEIKGAEEEKVSDENAPADDQSTNEQSVQKNTAIKPGGSDDTTRIGNKTKETSTEMQESRLGKYGKESLGSGPTGVNKPDIEDSKPDQEKEESGNDHHPRSSSLRVDKKRSDRSRDKTRDKDDRGDRRDRDHRKRSSRDKDGRSRDGDRDGSLSGRSSSGKKRRSSRARSRSVEHNESPGKSRDDRDRRHLRDRDNYSRRHRDRNRRPHYDYLRDMDRRSRDDRYPHHDDFFSRMGGGRGPPPHSLQRRGDANFGGNPKNHSEFGGGPPHHRHSHNRRGDDLETYGGEDRDPIRGECHGPGGFHAPPSRHPGGRGNRDPPHPHDGGRPPRPTGYYPSDGDQPPHSFRDSSGRRDRDGR